MLGAVCSDTSEMQVAINAINAFVAEAGRKTFNWEAPARERSACTPHSETRSRRSLCRGIFQCRTNSQRRDAISAHEDRSQVLRSPNRRPKPTTGAMATIGKAFGDIEYQHAARWCAEDQVRIDGRKLDDVRAITVAHRRVAAYARLGAVHARRNPGAGHRHARHRRAMRRSSMRSRASPRTRSCSITTSRRSRSAKRAA